MASRKVAYTSAVTDFIHGLIFKIKVGKPEHQKRQALITILKTLSGANASMPTSNKFSCFNLGGKSKKPDSMVQQMLAKPQLAIVLIVSAFE